MTYTTTEARRERYDQLGVEIATLEARMRAVAARGNDPLGYQELTRKHTALSVERARLLTEMRRPPGTGTDRAASAFGEQEEQRRQLAEQAAAIVAEQPLGPNEDMVRRLEAAGVRVSPTTRMAAGFERADREKAERERLEKERR